jgi:hypothetical protein
LFAQRGSEKCGGTFQRLGGRGGGAIKRGEGSLCKPSIIERISCGKECGESPVRIAGLVEKTCSMHAGFWIDVLAS